MFMSDIEILQMALIGYEAERQKIGVTMAAIRSVLGGRSSAQATTPTGDVKHKRRKMSAAARERIGDAQRKRWAAARKATEPAPATSKPKRKLSKSGRKAISEATKKRWAAFHAAKTAPVVIKKTAVKKVAVKKVAKKAAPVKKSAGKKAAPKKTAPAPAQPGTETAAQ